MRRVARLIFAATTLSALCGCAGPGLYRSIGSLPGVAWTDYAFTFYCDTATQLFQFSPPQVETSMLEALADLGFRVNDPPVHTDGECVISAKAPDGRTTRITIAPQNAMTMARVVIHPYLGDYQLSRDLLRRVALNFGSGMRAYTPVDLTVTRRINLPTPVPEPTHPRPPEALKGEGLRPRHHPEGIHRSRRDHGSRRGRPAGHERARHHGRLHTDHGLPEFAVHALRTLALLPSTKPRDGDAPRRVAKARRNADNQRESPSRPDRPPRRPQACERTDTAVAT